MPEQAREKQQGWWYPFTAVALVVVVALAVGLGVGLTNDNSAGENSGPTMAPTDSGGAGLDPITFFQQSIQNFSEAEYLQDPLYWDDEAPNQALEWLAEHVDIHRSMSEERIVTRFALAVLYFSTNHDPTWPAGWKKDLHFLDASMHECDWSMENNRNDRTLPDVGVTCSETTDSLETLYLASNGLMGTIPQEVSLLSTMEHLILEGNAISSTIPPALFTGVTSLQTFNVWWCDLTGTIPTEISHVADSLQVLDLQGNSFHGSFPWEELFRPPTLDKSPLRVFSVAHSEAEFDREAFPWDLLLEQSIALEKLIVGNNGWVGGDLPTSPISAYGEGLSQLQYLDISWMLLNSTIPDFFQDLTTLNELYLPDNELIGTIPSFVGEWTKLRTLGLWENSLTGPIPTELGLLVDLEHLYMWRNELSGTFPSELGNLNPAVVNFSGNNLSGSLEMLCDYGQIILRADCRPDLVCSCCDLC